VAAAGRNGGAEIRVTDTGIGMPPESLPLIFEPFQQAGNASRGRQHGSGLGLYIVKQLLQLLDGTIIVESEIGQGSTFRVWLPAGKGEDSQ
jgi:signal transduction histidine kinase